MQDMNDCSKTVNRIKSFIRYYEIAEAEYQHARDSWNEFEDPSYDPGIQEELEQRVYQEYDSLMECLKGKVQAYEQAKNKTQ